MTSSVPSPGAPTPPDGGRLAMPEGLTEEQQDAWVWDLELADRRANCTHSGGYAHRDDEDECPVSPPCTCGTYFDPYCPRHGDPGANLP